jgi:hypothetical protein
VRYCYQEPIVTTVIDKEITEDDELLRLLRALKEEQHNITISFEDLGQRDFIRGFETARITSVSESGEIDLHAYFNGASVKYAGIPMLNIRSIRLIANDQVSGTQKMKKFRSMDIS